MWTVRINGNPTVTCSTAGAALTSYGTAQHWKEQGHDVALYRAGARLLPARPWTSRSTYMEINMATPPWHMAAACRDIAAPDIFFPHPKEQEQFGAAPTKPYCGACPVVYECLFAAILDNEYGTWGGMTQGDRKRLKDRIKKSDVSVTSVDELRYYLEEILPRCRDCDQHRSHKEDGRCADCHRSHLALLTAQEKGICIEDECGARVHARSRCSHHYRKALRAERLAAKEEVAASCRN